MKRSPLRRKTELRRSGPLKRKKSMAKVSKKRRALNAVVNLGRKAFLEQYPVCMQCDLKRSVDVHEIARGAAREACLRHPELWMAVCRECHDELDDFTLWPPERQLFNRMMHDLGNTVATLNELRGRAAGAIGIDAVMNHWIKT